MRPFRVRVSAPSFAPESRAPAPTYREQRSKRSAPRGSPPARGCGRTTAPSPDARHSERTGHVAGMAPTHHQSSSFDLFWLAAGALIGAKDVAVIFDDFRHPICIVVLQKLDDSSVEVAGFINLKIHAFAPTFGTRNSDIYHSVFSRASQWGQSPSKCQPPSCGSHEHHASKSLPQTGQVTLRSSKRLP